MRLECKSMASAHTPAVANAAHTSPVSLHIHLLKHIIEAPLGGVGDFEVSESDLSLLEIGMTRLAPNRVLSA